MVEEGHDGHGQDLAADAAVAAVDQQEVHDDGVLALQEDEPLLAASEPQHAAPAPSQDFGDEALVAASSQEDEQLLHTDDEPLVADAQVHHDLAPAQVDEGLLAASEDPLTMAATNSEDLLASSAGDLAMSENLVDGTGMDGADEIVGGTADPFGDVPNHIEPLPDEPVTSERELVAPAMPSSLDLTDEERAVMQTHPVIGAQTLGQLESALDDAIDRIASSSAWRSLGGTMAIAGSATTRAPRASSRSESART